jgi:hypothetical protein
MKGRSFIILLALVVAVNGLACSIGGVGSVGGSGNVVEEEREVSNFTGVTLETVGNLYIELGDEDGLVIEAEDNLIEYFETEVDGKMLKIKTRGNANLSPTAPINFYLTMKELDTIVLAGSGDVEAPDVRGEKFVVSITGSGDIELGDLTVDTLEVSVDGSGDLHASGGTVQEQEITISGSGKYEARDLRSTNSAVSIPGSGSATIWVTGSLEVSIKGSGSVRYVGSPSLDKVTITGSGSIEQISP